MMPPRNFLFVTLAASIAVWSVPVSASGASAQSAPVYKGAIVIEASSGQVLFEDHADEISPPASMTKLMTFAVLEDRIKSGAIHLSTQVTITQAEAKVGAMKDSTSVWVKAGEVFPVEELIYAMMIQSANDAAYTLAFASAGSVPAFVDAMNAKARALGMTRTTFRSPNGFPPPSRRLADSDLTTPRDFATLCRYLIATTDVLKYTSVKSRAFGVGQRFPPTQMRNHNHLLGRIDGVDGLKTGFTNGAGFCLSATASRNGRRIIAVMMDSPDSKSRDLKISQLIERGFAIKPLVIAPIAGPAPTPGPAAAPALTTPSRPGATASAKASGVADPGAPLTIPGITR
jgi:D-alanyl-D-alanine carboxypeptidase (penicillin-binding protein 5/6)